MTDKTENGAPRGRRDAMVKKAVQEAAARLEHRARLEALAQTDRTGHRGRTVPMVWTDAMVDRDRAERRARLGMPDRPAPLVRRVNAARRVTRAIGAILARLVKRANL
jgi:hypothetical protein